MDPKLVELRTMPWEALSDTGVLWAINRYIFHPRGYAFTVTYNDEGQAVGWFIQGRGDEPWSFVPEDDDAKFLKFEDTMAHVIEQCTFEPGHETPCNGWPCDWAIKEFLS